jgi:hypothetical protein
LGDKRKSKYKNQPHKNECLNDLSSAFHISLLLMVEFKKLCCSEK